MSEAERQVAALRQREGETREPVQEARSALGRAETEARTLAKILQAGSQGLFPSVVEQMKVDKGFETALGAALGEDLDLPLDRSAAAYWSDSVFAHETAALPEGATPLSSACARATTSLQRRLSQIGIVDEADAAKLAKQLRPGQRLVTKQGALWRWDGFIAGADAPTAAAQRLAQKNRLAELDAEVAAASAQVEQRACRPRPTPRRRWQNASMPSGRRARRRRRPCAASRWRARPWPPPSARRANCRAARRC